MNLRMSTAPDTVVAGKPSQAKVISATDGAQVTRAGQRLEDPIGTAIMSCYSNLVYSPLIVVLYVFALSCTAASIFGVEGPLEFAADEIQKTYNTTKAPAVKALAGASYRIVKYVLVYQTVAITVCLVWLPYAKKPSSKNFNASVLFTVLSFLISGLGLLELFLLTQCWFLYTELRNPRHKLFVAAFVGFLIIFQYMADPAQGQITNKPKRIYHYNWPTSSKEIEFSPVKFSKPVVIETQTTTVFSQPVTPASTTSELANVPVKHSSFPYSKRPDGTSSLSRSDMPQIIFEHNRRKNLRQLPTDP
ncbi:hypothetical protein [Hubei virga-like virus 16]|uniref:hypothetical protein n=1 Tax=Hubei virga-like virus 16 TaxID=1923331 RepID=UPI00090C7F37|nr:hypothetical protein [Hubei virga-like virus 16]APG77527.1 hypothetical protein [Hubei virga-like virus 16]